MGLNRIVPDHVMAQTNSFQTVAEEFSRLDPRPSVWDLW